MTPAREAIRKSPDPSDNFVYGIINQPLTQSEELCARYGGTGDCLEEVEVCLTMRDSEDNQVKPCLNTIPGDDRDIGDAVHKSHLRRQPR